MEKLGNKVQKNKEKISVIIQIGIAISYILLTIRKVSRVSAKKFKKV